MNNRISIVKTAFLLIVSVVLAISNTGCQKKEQLPAEIDKLLTDINKKVVKIGIFGDPMSLSPITHQRFEHTEMIEHFVHASPLRKQSDGSFVPYLFESYSLNKDKNGKQIILDAIWKTGLKWHDGSDFDIRDLEYTLNMIKDQQVSSPYFDLVKGIVDISSDIVGNTTRIVFSDDSRQYLDLLAIGLMPSHLLKDIEYEEPVFGKAENKKVVATDTYSWTEYATKPVGMGPFRIKDRKLGSYLLLEPNLDFPDNKIASRPLVLFRTYYGYQSLLTDFRSKKLNWINMPSMLSGQFELIAMEGIKLVKYPNPAHMVWIFNQNKPLLNDSRFRKALDLLIDRRSIKNVFSADAKLLYENPLASGTELRSSYADRFTMALELLDNIGLKDSNEDGIRENATSPFEINILTNDDNLMRRAVAKKMIENLEKGGIKASITAVSWSEMISGRMRKADFDTALLSLKLPEAGNWINILHSKPSGDSLNFTGVENPNLDSALESLDSIFSNSDTAKSKKIVSDFLEENRPMVFLLQPYDIGLYHDETGILYTSSYIWDSILSWDILFGSENKQL